jgi:hypothetical protein
MPETPQATWLKLAVMTIMVLAAGASLAAIRASGYAAQVQIFAAREARLWQDYQVESIQKDNTGLNRDILATLKPPETKTSKPAKTLAFRIKDYEDEMVRLNRERDQIKKEAQALGVQEETLAKKAGELGLVVILFQLGIMSAAAGVITRKKILWLVSLGLGVWGLVYLVKNLWW